MKQHTSPEIHPARIGDGLELTNLALESKAFWGYPEEFIKSCETALKIDDKKIINWTSGTIKEADVFAGFYFLSIEDATAELQLLYVSPFAMGKGYGRALFKDAMEKASKLGYHSVRIEADPNAANFYKRMGAKLIGWCRSEVDDERELPLFNMKL
jgi:GNAT superfamily N-acetyltransferase